MNAPQHMSHTNGHQHHHHAGKEVVPSVPGVGPWIQGWVGVGDLCGFYLSWPGTGCKCEVCEWPVINETSSDASRHPGLLGSCMPLVDVTKGRVEIIGPLDARGV